MTREEIEALINQSVDAAIKKERERLIRIICEADENNEETDTAFYALNMFDEILDELRNAED